VLILLLLLCAGLVLESLAAEATKVEMKHVNLSACLRAWVGLDWRDNFKKFKLSWNCWDVSRVLI
jgi:hypothetical protein